MRAVAEAPSKVVITGEHFVVHGAWALAAALPRRVRVEVEEAPRLQVSSDLGPDAKSRLRPVERVVQALAREYSVPSAVKVSVTSAIPEGAGLGSSASTMVATAAAFSRFHSLRLGVGQLTRFAMVGEQDVHGRPSGIDPTVSALGGVILFKPGSRARRLELPGRRSLIVAFSGIRRSTRGQIGKVAEVRERFPGFFSMLADAVGDLSLEAAQSLEEGDMRRVGSLLAVNHAALAALGVSNGTLDGMVDLMASAGAYGAKVTGGGGGGSVVGVCPEAKQKKILSTLSARGFDTFSARIPTEGVRSWLER